MDRLRCSAFLAMSLDGFIAREDGRFDWPYSGKRCVVLSHRPAPSRHGEEFSAGTPAEIADQLARTGARRAYVDGGVVVTAFLAAGRLDDLTVSIVPVVLGSGIRLFQGALRECTLVLDTCRSFPSGLAQLRYRARPGAPR